MASLAFAALSVTALFALSSAPVRSSLLQPVATTPESRSSPVDNERATYEAPPNKNGMMIRDRPVDLEKMDDGRHVGYRDMRASIGQLNQRLVSGTF